MKNGEILEGVVERVDFPDKGIIMTDTGIVTVRGVFPGQTVRFVVSRKRGGVTEGRVLEVLKKSAVESLEPLCSIFPECGGCTWQTMGYEDQLLMKEGQIRRLLEPVFDGTEDTEFENIFEGIIPSPHESAYRNKMEFSFGDEQKGGPLCLGQHKRGSYHDILTASDCRLVHEDMTAILKCTLDFFRSKDIPYFHKQTHEGILRHLLLRRSESTGDIMAALVTAGPFGCDCDGEGAADESGHENEKQHYYAQILQEYRERLQSLKLKGRITGIMHMQNDSVADIVQSDKTTVLYGTDCIYETLLGLRFKITPFSFFQTNTAGAEILYGVVRNFIGNTKASTLFDLYSGTGTIAQILSPFAENVIGVEISEEAVAAAKTNAAANGIKNCTFIAGDVLKVLDTIPYSPDFIILDPPRDGINPRALTKIISYSAEHIIYISCKPTSLARDLNVLIDGGYTARRICCVDMFPQTANTETVVLLSRGETES